MGAIAERTSRSGDVAKVRAWEDIQTQAIKPQADYVAVLRDHIADDATLVSELTQVGYFSNIAYPVYAPRTLVTPGFQGTLGYGFPTALGVSAGAPEKRTVSITGDGGFGWALQELATAAKYRLNLTTIVFADGYFGNVRRIQKRAFGRVIGADLHNPDFQLLAQAFGVRCERVRSPADLASALVAAKIAGGPSLIEVQVGEMPSPWALIHPFVPAAIPPPANPLDELTTNAEAAN
jgi:acetolactate synthase-1/2/3 large subunit